jgi:serine/threonine-protein kinase
VLVGVDGIARVLDFGVAKALGKQHTTREGQLKGKLGYLAPEQVLGHSVTRRSDVFAAAIVLWEALAGERLFTAESEGAVLRQIMEDEVEPPSRRRPEVPAALDAVVMQALAKEPGFRFDTALAMAEAIEGAVAVAPPRAIGEWVRDLARERLAMRAQLVGAIESGTAGGHAEPAAASSGADEASTHVSVVTDASGKPASRRGRWAWLALGAAAVGVAAVVTLARGRGPAHVPPAPEVAPAASAPALSAAPEASTASAAPSASSAPSVLSSPPPARPAAAPHRRPASPRPAPRPVGTSLYTRD